MTEIQFFMATNFSLHVIKAYNQFAVIDPGSDITICTAGEEFVRNNFEVVRQRKRDKEIDTPTGGMTGTFYIVKEFALKQYVIKNMPIFVPDCETRLKTKLTLGRDLFEGTIYEFDTIRHLFTIRIPDDRVIRQYYWFE